MKELIKRTLKEKGKTQVWLAGQLGINRQQLRQLLDGKDIKLQNAFKIVDILEIDINEFRKEE